MTPKNERFIEIGFHGEIVSIEEAVKRIFRNMKKMNTDAELREPGPNNLSNITWNCP
jgi:hypothetical protein